jgi:hypothetical protein
MGQHRKPKKTPILPTEGYFDIVGESEFEERPDQQNDRPNPNTDKKDPNKEYVERALKGWIKLWLIDVFD